MIPDGTLGVFVVLVAASLFVDAPIRTGILALIYWGGLP